MKRILLFMALILGTVAVQANPADNIEVSVLTCSPGQEVYSLYGHTAIRVRDRVAGTDHVFNYGVFDFNSENFMWRFVLGETDYMCTATPWEYFIVEYQARGSSVVEQTLNLTEAEATNFKNYLYENIRKENRVYRYNFLTNNCTTRVMDCVDACVDGELAYSWKEEPQTYRTILHEYTKDFPWTQEGNDILLGADVDTLLSYRATCFIPYNFMSALAGATVRNEFQDTRRLVKETATVTEARPQALSAKNTLPVTPKEFGVIAIALALVIMAIEFLSRKMLWPLDIMLMLAHGLAGCLITFMFLFSEHPAVGSNWLVGIINPLPLVILPFAIKAAWHDKHTLWHHFMAVWIALFLLFMPWMPQKMCTLTVPVLAILLSRQISYILHYRLIPATQGKHSRKTSTKKKNKK